MRRALGAFSVRTKLLLVVGISFALASAAVIFVADRIMTAKANEQGMQLSAERLDSIFGLLERKQDILAIGTALTDLRVVPTLFVEHLQGISVAFLIVYTLLCVYRIANGLMERYRL